MDQLLAEFYGNVKTASAQTETASPEQVKQAQVDLFMKLAADNNIDLEALNEDQIAHLWNATFEKAASDKDEEEKEKESEGEPPPFAKKDDKEEAAKKEHEEKKEAMAKMAEADFLGRVMAHSMVNELRKIASANEGGEGEGESKEAAMPAALAKALGKAKDVAGKAADKGGKALESVGKKVTEKATGVGTHGMKPSHAKAVGGATVGAGAAAAGGAAFAAKKGLSKDKKASAIDELALEEAVKMAGEAGFDAEEAAAKVAAVATLSLLGESEKVASAPDHAAAIGVRALEYLEAAGYPVTWES